MQPSGPRQLGVLDRPTHQVEPALLMLREKHRDFIRVLERAVAQIKNDHHSGARELEKNALNELRSIVTDTTHTATNQSDLWQLMLVAATELICARPSMSAAIKSRFLKVLSSVEQVWRYQASTPDRPQATVQQLVSLAKLQFDGCQRQRVANARLLSEHFVKWLKSFVEDKKVFETWTGTVSILALSNSSTIRACILTCFALLPEIEIKLHILESRPHFEGADMAAHILTTLGDLVETRPIIHIVPDCAVAAIAKDVDVFVLGADRISASGDVSNKIGSLTAAVCVKHMNPSAKIVVVSDSEKIAPNRPENQEPVEKHPDSELRGSWKPETNVQLNKYIGNGEADIFGEWFEWVPAQYIDKYITEDGDCSRSFVRRKADDVGILEKNIFGRRI